MSSSNDLALGKRVKQLRLAKGMTQEKLAEKIERSAKYIQFIEAGNRRPSLETLYRLASCLGVKVGDLFTF